MKKMPLISVIVPVYNGEAYVKNCIENILKQSYKELEIIVVDDGSTDNSALIAQQYPVKLIQFPENKGLSIARNTAIEKAQGEYIHFHDVDDTINTDFYQEMVDALVDTAADLACSGIINESKPHRTTVFSEKKLISDVPEKLKVTNVGRWGYSVRYLFKKSLLNAYNIRFEEGRFIEDLPFSLAAVYFSNSLVTVPNAVYTYVRQENSIMTNKNRAHKKKRRQDLRHTREIRHNFARKYKIKIPGVPTGRFALFFVKWFT